MLRVPNDERGRSWLIVLVQHVERQRLRGNIRIAAEGPEHERSTHINGLVSNRGEHWRSVYHKHGGRRAGCGAAEIADHDRIIACLRYGDR